MSASADPLARFEVGDRINDVLRADTLNAWNEAADAHRRRRAEQGNAFESNTDDCTNIFIQNGTGSDLSQFGVVAISGAAPLILPSESLPDFRERRALVVGVPYVGCTPAILQEPVGQQKLGLATIVGLTPAVVNVTDASHAYAVPTSSLTQLSSAASGAIPILWKESGTGVKNAVVLLTSTSDGPTIDVVTNVCSNASPSDASTVIGGGTFGGPKPVSGVAPATVASGGGSATMSGSAVLKSQAFGW